MEKCDFLYLLYFRSGVSNLRPTSQSWASKLSKPITLINCYFINTNPNLKKCEHEMVLIFSSTYVKDIFKNKYVKSKNITDLSDDNLQATLFID